MKIFRLRHFVLSLLTISFCYSAIAQEDKIIEVNINTDRSYQTIQNFAASDAWSCQFVGNWPGAKKNAIADWLFSMDTLANGNPKGIGLTMWRYNLGAGSAEQEDSSGIKDEWRRAALTLNNNEKVQAQNWFLQAAKQRGVQQFLGFFNSPPVQFTKNGKAFTDSGKCNIEHNNYEAFAGYAVNAIHQTMQSTGVMFDYISPVNEPQWDWSDGGQEGCPYTNEQVSELVKTFSKIFQQQNIGTKLLITESGQLNYLLPAINKKDKDNQAYDFFNPNSSLYVGDLPNLTKAIAGHSYFTTSPFQKAMTLRATIRDSLSKIKDLEYWQSEYCVLGDNYGEISGNKRDLGMNTALYVAKVVYEDLVGANASAWQWWLAISSYDYKDGLIYVDKNKTDGGYYDSKTLWALGNYSRFIRPGMQRIEVNTASKDVYVSGFKNVKDGNVVVIIINASNDERSIKFANHNLSGNIICYTTSETGNLEKNVSPAHNLTIPSRSVVTLLLPVITL